MTSKHFDLIARVFNNNQPRTTWITKRQQWRDDCKAMAKECALINRNFIIFRFLEACGWTGDELYEIG